MSQVDSGLSNVEKILGVSLSTVSDSKGTTTSSSSDVSTIQPSQQQQEDAKKASVPWMAPMLFDFITTFQQPLPVVDVEKMLAKAMSDCVTMICDKWSQNVKEVSRADQRKVEENIRRGLDRLVSDMVNPKGSAASEEAGKAVAALFAMAMLMVAGVAVVQVGLIHLPGVAMTHEIIQVAASVGLVQPNMAAELGLLGALFASFTFYPALSMTMAKEKKIGGDVDQAFVDNYLKNVKSFVTSDGFKMLVETTITSRIPGSESFTQLQRDQVTATVAISLLMAALGIMTKMEEGSVSGASVAAIMKGEVQLPQQDPRNGLIELIFRYRDILGSKTSSNLFEKIFAKLDNNPTVSDLLKATDFMGETTADADKASRERITDTPV